MQNYRDLLHELIPNFDMRILEIGPLNYPLVKKSEYPNVIYCDIRNTEQIKALYSGNNYLKITGITVDINSIIDIDLVLNESYEKTFADKPKFDYIVASHVLEHVDDLIFTLCDIATILKPGGQFIIYYPDKRYCFDHFREEVSFRDVYERHISQRSALSRLIFDFFNSAIKENDPVKFWKAENMHDLLPTNDTQTVLNFCQEFSSGHFMDDVHYWPFSDAGFIKFLYDATRAGIIKYSCKNFYPTLENTQQFLVVLENKIDNWNLNYELQNLRICYSNVEDRYYCSNNIKAKEELVRLNELLEAERQELLRTKQELAYAHLHVKNLQQYIFNLENSTSWQITKPLRSIKNLFTKRTKNEMEKSTTSR
jgi:predicted SAM-dependent methyltransferase